MKLKKVDYDRLILRIFRSYAQLLFLTGKFHNRALGLAFVFALTGFMGGFLMVGIPVGLQAGLVAIFFEMPGLSLAVFAMFDLTMSGLILYETSNIIHGGKTNYIMATVILYVSIFKPLSSLLHLQGSMGGNE